VVELEPGVPLICWALTVTAAQQKEQGGRGQFEQTSILREFIRSIHVDRSFRGQYCVPKTFIFGTSGFNSETQRFLGFKLLQTSSQIL
jgi:hypothetical protein